MRYWKGEDDDVVETLRHLGGPSEGSTARPKEKTVSRKLFGGMVDLQEKVLGGEANGISYILWQY